MIVDIFTLCDSAKEYQGKLVIVGNLIFNVNNLLIPSAGKYVVTLEIGELVKESTLYVVTVKQ